MSLGNGVVVIRDFILPIAIIVAIALFLAVRHLGPIISTLIMCAMALAVVPFTLATTSSIAHVGIAGAGLGISTYGIAICVGLIVLCFHPGTKVSLTPFVPLAAQRRWRAVGVENMGRVAFQALAR